MNATSTPPDPTPRQSEDQASHHVAVWIDAPNTADALIPHARAMARAFGGRITLVRVVEGTDRGAGRPADPLDWDIARREAREHLEQVAREHLGGLPVDTAVLEGDTADAVPSWAGRNGVNVTVVCCGMAGEGRQATARSLVESMPGSVLVARAHGPAPAEAEGYRRVLVPVDGSPRAESVLPVALQMAAGGELLIVHVVPEPGLTEIGPFDREDLALAERVTQRNIRVATEYLDRLRDRLPPGDTAVRVVVVQDGDVRTRLERLLRDEAVDLVVMSSHGHTGRVGVPYGSVTADLILESAVPLFIVRPADAQVGRPHPADAVRLPRQAST